MSFSGSQGSEKEQSGKRNSSVTHGMYLIQLLEEGLAEQEEDVDGSEGRMV